MTWHIGLAIPICLLKLPEYCYITELNKMSDNVLCTTDITKLIKCQVLLLSHVLSDIALFSLERKDS